MTKLLKVFLVILASGSGCQKDPEAPPPAPKKEIAQTGPAWLEDATEKFGVNFIHEVGPVGTYFMPEQVGSGAAIFDFDSD